MLLVLVFLALLLAGLWIWKPRVSQRVSRVSIRVSLVAVFAALSLGTNYALTGVPNVKLMDTFYFMATYLFGLSIGLPVVVLTRTIYALVNPWGPASGWLVAMLVLGDCVYALSGCLARRAGLAWRSGTSERSIVLGLVGLFSALGFDLITNFGSGLLVLTGPDLQTYLGRALVWGLITMNFPLPLGIIHEASDFLFFSTVAPAAISLAKRSYLFEMSRLSKPLIREPGAA